MKPTRHANRIAGYYDPPSHPRLAGGYGYRRERPQPVVPGHRLGGPVAGLGAALLQCLLGGGITLVAAATLLGVEPPLSPAGIALAIGLTMTAAGALATYAGLVEAARASAEDRQHDAGEL